MVFNGIQFDGIRWNQMVFDGILHTVLEYLMVFIDVWESFAFDGI